MPKLKFIIACREEIEEGLAVRIPHVVISIRDPDLPKVRLRKNGLCKGVLRLAFHDAEPTKQLVLPPDIRLMTENDAQAIWRFVNEHLDSIEGVVVHCEQGMSRSPAVAAGLTVGMGGKAERFFREFQPNQYVFSLVSRAAPEV